MTNEFNLIKELEVLPESWWDTLDRVKAKADRRFSPSFFSGIDDCLRIDDCIPIVRIRSNEQSKKDGKL